MKLSSSWLLLVTWLVLMAVSAVTGETVEGAQCGAKLRNQVCGNFAVYGRTTITFDGVSSTIDGGNVGVSPGTSITGDHEFLQGGGQDASPEDSDDFADSVTAAHFAAMKVRSDGIQMKKEMGGELFTPGTYKSDSAINIAHGTVVTLSGEGFYLFQVGTTLVTGAGTKIILTNGARAENVIWALGTTATLGASSVLEGSILAGTAITFGKQAELHGCALSQSYVMFESEGSIVMSEVLLS